MSDETPLFPAQVEQKIVTLANRLAKSAKVCDERYGMFLDADREYDRAFNRAYLEHDGPQPERKAAAVLESMDEREARDVADAAYKYADRLARNLRDELSALQSVNRSVLATYGAAGVGER